MDISNTITFSVISNFFQSFWSEPVGRIFITTAIAYSISYIIYSSYISWFAGGYGSILLGQLGFTAADFLALFPTSIYLIMATIRSSIKPFATYIFVNIALPVILTLVLFAVRFAGWQSPIQENSFINSIGLLIFLMGLFLSIRPSKNKRATIIAISLTYIGIIVFALSASITTIQSTIPTSQNNSFIEKILDELLSFLVLIIIVLLPPIIGLRMASFAVNENLLSRIVCIILNQPIQTPSLLHQKSKNKPERVFTYQPKLGQPVYLIASFSKITAIYIPPEIIGTERGRMHLLSNDIICSIEIEGRRNEKFNETKVVK